MAEFRVYVTPPGRYSSVSLPPSGEFDMHLISGPLRTCSVGFWCGRCHPQLITPTGFDLRKIRG